MKKYADASVDLQKALDLQRAANQEDSHTVDALAESYVLAEKFDRALPLLVTVTTRPGAKPDPSFLYYRGLAEFKTGKTAEAEKSFNAAVKADPKNPGHGQYFQAPAYDGGVAPSTSATVRAFFEAERGTDNTFPAGRSVVVAQPLGQRATPITSRPCMLANRS